MDKVSGTLYVFFQEPFWVGVFERAADGKVSASKVTFGQEPKDYHVYEFILNHYSRLRFSPAVAAGAEEKADEGPKRVNPKRMRREVRRQSQKTGIGTKSQQAVKLEQALKVQQEQLKTERKAQSRRQREEEKQRQFELKQQKKKEKHKGR